MDFNTFIFKFLTFGIYKNWDEVKEGVPSVLLWTIIIIPLVGYAFFNVSPQGNPFEPFIYTFGSPLRRVGEAGLDTIKTQVEINNNAVSGNGFKPGSVEGLEDSLVEENQD